MHLQKMPNANRSVFAQLNRSYVPSSSIKKTGFWTTSYKGADRLLSVAASAAPTLGWDASRDKIKLLNSAFIFPSLIEAGVALAQDTVGFGKRCFEKERQKEIKAEGSLKKICISSAVFFNKGIKAVSCVQKMGMHDLRVLSSHIPTFFIKAYFLVPFAVTAKKVIQSGVKLRHLGQVQSHAPPCFSYAIKEEKFTETARLMGKIIKLGEEGLISASLFFSLGFSNGTSLFVSTTVFALSLLEKIGKGSGLPHGKNGFHASGLTKKCLIN